MSGIRNLTGICQDIHRNRANVDTPPSGPSTSSRSGRYYRRLSQVRRLVVTSAELVWRNAKTNFNGKVVKGHERKVFRSRRCDADSWNFKIDDFGENSVELTEELLEAIRILNDAQDKDYAQKCHIE